MAADAARGTFSSALIKLTKKVNVEEPRRLTWTIRQAREDELEACRRVFNRARRSVDAFGPDADLDRDAFLEAVRDEYILAALNAEGEITGFAGVYTPDAFLHHLYIDPDHHRCGVGRRLVDAACAICERPLRLKSLTENIGARAFYAALGWSERPDGGVSPDGEWIWVDAPA